MKRFNFQLITSILIFSVLLTACDVLTETEEKKSFSITFDKNDSLATGNMAQQIIENDATVKLNKNEFVKPGWSFIGWSTNSIGDVEFPDTSNFTMGKSDITLYAQWKANTYTISFDKNDNEAIGITPNHSANSGTVVILNPCGYTKTGWTFIGWAISPDGEVIYSDASNYIIGIEDAVLYAKWKINQYKITYIGNGNTGGIAPNPETYDYKTIVTVAGNTGNLIMVDNVSHNYNFLGWNTHEEGEGNNYQAGVGTFVLTQDTVLYAHWDLYYIGKAGPAGGFIFYDKGNYENNWRYLEAASLGGQWINVTWGAYGHLIGTQTGIGTGKQNTSKIMSWIVGKDDSVRAAFLCSSLNLGGYNDWFLPSRDELYKMYENLRKNGIGQVQGPYWSSSEINDKSAWGFEMDDGAFTSGEMINKLNVSLTVRAIRAF